MAPPPCRTILAIYTTASARRWEPSWVHRDRQLGPAAAFLLGGSTFPLYSLSLSHVNDVLTPDQTIAASSVFLLVTGIGSVLGPLDGSALMTANGPSALFWLIGAVHGAVAIYASYRIIAREGPAVSDQRQYLRIPARASGLIGVLTRSRRRNDG